MRTVDNRAVVIVNGGTRSSALRMFSVVIPARDEEGSLPSTVRDIFRTFESQCVPHEIVVVDDGSSDRTWEVLKELEDEVPTLRAIKNPGPNGFGRAVVYGIDNSFGDALVIMMADASDSADDAVRYWRLLNDGYDCAFGSRFVRGGIVRDYPWVKLVVNRVANRFIQCGFRIPLDDTTNAFKAYRRSAIDGCRPLLAPHFNLTVELPLKAIVRGYTYAITPISWQNRKHGEPKLKIKEMGSRYFFICAYVWLEKCFSRGDYVRRASPEPSAR
jgi:dolichol-phosphate mannosyltransferase